MVKITTLNLKIKADSRSFLKLFHFNFGDDFIFSCSFLLLKNVKVVL